MKSLFKIFKCVRHVQRVFLYPLFVCSFVSLINSQEPGESLFINNTGNIQTYNDSIPILIPYPSPTFERRPSLKWHKPSIEITKYYIQISTLPSFTTTIVYVSVNDTTYTPTIDLLIDTIYWRVKADESDWSDTSSFILKDNRIPLLIQYQPDLTNETKPALTWRSVDSATSYTIEIDNNSDFSSTIISIPLTGTIFTPFETLPLGEIYWRVKSNLVDTWSAVDHFTIITDTIPLLIMYNGKTITEKRPTFTWHPVSDTDSYKILLSDNINFTDAITEEDLSDTFYTPESNLDYGKWFWKVSCSKNPDLFSPVDSLEIDSLITFIEQDVSLNKKGVCFQELKDAVRIVINGFPCNDICANVYNVKGRLVSTLKPLSNKNNVLIWKYKGNNLHAITPGMYVIRLNAQEKVYIHKVIVNK